jgi:hypothetical protein
VEDPRIKDYLELASLRTVAPPTAVPANLLAEAGRAHCKHLESRGLVQCHSKRKQKAIQGGSGLECPKFSKEQEAAKKQGFGRHKRRKTQNSFQGRLVGVQTREEKYMN